jgi:hypothetical protein
LTAYSRRDRAGSLSHRQRSWDSPFGAFPSRKVSATFPGGRTHLPFHLSVIPPPKRWAGPTGRGSWALTLPRVPGDRTGFNSPTAGCSHGLCPSRAYEPKPCPGSHPCSSHALCENQPCDWRPPAPRSINRLQPDPICHARQADRDGWDNPCRVPAPDQPQPFKRFAARAMCSPHTAPCITADRQYSLGNCPRSTGVARG